jgi:hypothetical protein
VHGERTDNARRRAHASLRAQEKPQLTRGFHVAGCENVPTPARGHPRRVWASRASSPGGRIAGSENVPHRPDNPRPILRVWASRASSPGGRIGLRLPAGGVSCTRVVGDTFSVFFVQALLVSNLYHIEYCYVCVCTVM